MDLGSVCAKPEPIGCPLPPGPSRQGLLTVTQPQEGLCPRPRSEDSECIRTPQSKVGVGGDGSRLPVIRVPLPQMFSGVSVALGLPDRGPTPDLVPRARDARLP